MSGTTNTANVMPEIQSLTGEDLRKEFMRQAAALPKDKQEALLAYMKELKREQDEESEITQTDISVLNVQVNGAPLKGESC